MPEEYYFSDDEIRTFVLNKMAELNISPVYRDQHLIIDSKIHRYTIQGQKKKNGAYKIHSDGIPACYIQDWSNPDAEYTFTMKDAGKRIDFNSDEWKKQNEERKKREAAREAEIQKKYADAATFAKVYFDNAFNGSFQHAYLTNKQIQAHGVRVDINQNILIIPLYDIEGNFVSAQYIYEDGSKKFNYGAKTSGVFFPFGLDKLKDGDNKILLLCEGFATGAKIYELIGNGAAVISAMNCGNLDKVAQDLKLKYPERKIIVMADNDIKTFLTKGFNPGVDAAKKLVANNLALDYIAPPFDPENPEGSDWDDYAIVFGNKAAQEAMKKRLRYIFLPADTKKLLSRVECINAQALKTKVFQPIVWAVDGFLPSGLSILAGGPKVGKSILSLHLSLAVAIGGCALGKINVQQGDVLYLALEDTQRRLQERIEGSGLPNDCDLSRLTLATVVPRQHEGGLEFIRWWLEEHKQARLVIIDTLQKFRKQLSNKGNVYSEDYDTVSEIKKIADGYNIPFLLIHHLKKAMQEDWLNELSGSQGIAGAADTIFSLKRSRTEYHGVLHRTGRDVEETDFNMELDGFNWILMDEIENSASSEWKKAIIDYLKYRESATPMDLSIALNIDIHTAQKQLQRLANDGIVKRIRRGVYSLS